MTPGTAIFGWPPAAERATHALVNAPRLSDYDFHLPQELIAQVPAPGRPASRMMIVARHAGIEREGTFSDLPRVLRGDELLVFNDTRVVPARIRGQKDSGGRFELLVLEAVPDRPAFVAMGRSSKGFSPGQRLYPAAAPNDPPLVVAAVLGEGRLVVTLPDGAPPLWEWLERVGELPLPPYIERPTGPTAEDGERYQTVFAAHPGSVAAPTAGLHFDDTLLAAIAARGCRTARVTLHVGPGTFAPVRTDDLSEHVMHSERYEVSEAASSAIAEARREGRRLLAVGTTVVRTLEAVAARHDGAIPPEQGVTDIFIREGHPFRAVDQLITNFHLPRSTLLMLVSAFAGRDVMLGAYNDAVSRRYRFFSYGDGMLLR